VSTATWDIIQLDYSPAPEEPTLRQMIMLMKTKESNIPLFHCVDLDWRGEGYTFQYAPGVRVEAECTINTLLPILRYKYPDINVECYFSHEAIDRCEGYKYDESRGTVVDNLVSDHLTFIDEENLLGFSLNSNQIDELDNKVDNEMRPVQSATLYNDSDSVSTLAKPGGSFITPPLTSNVSFARRAPRSTDNTSITSSISTVTMDTIATMDNKISALTTHMLNNDKKFDEIMKYLMTNNAGGQASSTIPQIGTTDNGNLEAGDDSVSISGSVP
jgi:hypothetical protein